MAQVIAGDGLSKNEYVTIDGAAGEGTIFTNAAEAFTLNAYAAVEVIAAGISKAQSADGTEAVAAALEDGSKVPTAIGKLTYGEAGDLTSQSFAIYKWEAGKTVAAE